MRLIQLKVWRWQLTIGLSLVGLVIMAIQFWSFVSAQTNRCSRPELSPAPPPIISQQPTLLNIATALTAEADRHHWPDWLLKTIAK